MQKTILTAAGLALALGCLGQNDTNALKKQERTLNYFAFRKYNINITTGPYFSTEHAHSLQDNFWLFELKFTDRISALGVGKDGDLMVTWGVGFKPYQGTTASWGLGYELFSKGWKVNACAGVQYTLGFDQVSSNDGQHYVSVGYHNYVVPNLNLVWWPWKVEISSTRSPGFGQLLFLKCQVAYSYLFTKLSVSATPGFDSHLFQAIQNNCGNTVLLMIGVGVSIPSRKDEGKYAGFRYSQLHL